MDDSEPEKMPLTERFDCAGFSATRFGRVVIEPDGATVYRNSAEAAERMSEIREWAAARSGGDFNV